MEWNLVNLRKSPVKLFTLKKEKLLLEHYSSNLLFSVEMLCQLSFLPLWPKYINLIKPNKLNRALTLLKRKFSEYKYICIRSKYLIYKYIYKYINI